MSQESLSAASYPLPNSGNEQDSQKIIQAKQSDFLSILSDIGYLLEPDSELLKRLASDQNEVDYWTDKMIDSYNILNYFEKSIRELGIEKSINAAMKEFVDVSNPQQREHLRHAVAQWRKARELLLAVLISAGDECVKEVSKTFREIVEARVKEHKIQSETA